MTYREMLDMFGNLTDRQLDCDVTVEDPFNEECYPADFRICSKDHDKLDEDHPVIFIT